MAKVPIRTCIACRRSSCKGDFLRIVKPTDGQVRYDASGKLPGRGAYLCPSLRCVEAAFKQNKIGRALRTSALGQVKTELEDAISRHGACE